MCDKVIDVIKSVQACQRQSGSMSVMSVWKECDGWIKQSKREKMRTIQVPTLQHMDWESRFLSESYTTHAFGNVPNIV